MARGGTTHVLEIESGIGEPAFIPLTQGQELSPISVGKKGMWRIESARVLDVHAFLYFDGTALFIQSADEQTPALADGRAVGTQWTELGLPCRIEVGQARIRFRSLAQAQDDQAQTFAMETAPVRGQPGGPLGLHPATPSAANGIPAKPERPFAPGEFSSRSDESTRIAPVENSKVSRAAPRPAAGMPAGPSPSGVVVPPTMGASASYPAAAVPMTPMGGSGMHPAMGMPPVGPGMPPPGGPVMGPPSMPPPMGGPGMHGVVPTPAPSNPPYAPNAPGYVPPPGPSVSGAYPPPGPSASGAYPPHGSMPPGSMPPSRVPTSPQGGPPKKRDLATQWREMPAFRRIIILMSPLFISSAYYSIVGGDGGRPRPPPPQGSVEVAPGPSMLPPPSLPSEMPATMTTAAAPGITDAGVAELPPLVPGLPTTTTPPTTATIAHGRDAGGPFVADKKTLERLAVDAYISGDYVSAARHYDRLAEQTRPPSNIVYLEAARIIRAKLDAGAH